MRVIQKLKLVLATFVLFSIIIPNANSAEECFEKTSRAIFKFNMALDDIILEPLAKGYNKLPSPVKTGTSNFTSNIGTLLSIPNNIFFTNNKTKVGLDFVTILNRILKLRRKESLKVQEFKA